VEPLPDDVRLIIGLQPVREALRVNGSNARRLYALQDNPRCDRLAEFAGTFGVEVRRVAAGELDRLTHNARHQGVALLAPTLTLADWEQVVVRPDLLVVALDKISDPQNFGAIVRSAVALGGAAVLWGEHSSAPLTPATFRASAGAVEHATLCRVGSLVTALDRADAMAVQIVGLDAQADRVLSAVDLRLPTVIALGAEDRGLSRAVRQRCTVVAKLPMTRALDSLNVSAAAAIALYEAAQQRARTSE
jgi:23S rRNA (guanosine2251-2'-O)-methyltransferase